MAKKKLKAVLVGCGSMSRAWLDPASKMKNVEFVGLVDVVRKAAEARAEGYGLLPDVVYDDLAEAIKATSPDIVFDVTIPDAHDTVTITALRAGCHVLGEKPMSVSMPRARKMVAEAEKADRIYAVIQNRRYEPNIQRVGKLIRSGKLGRVEEVHCDFYIGAHFGGFRDEMEHPLLVDMAIHTFDAARYISQADPVAVYCHAFNPKRSWYKGDASAVGVFEMTDDITYTYRGSWCAEGLGTSWNSQWRIVCSKGTITWTGDGEVKAQRIKPKGKHAFFSDMEDVAVPELSVKHQGHEGLIREFVKCVETGAVPQTICTDNIKSLAMVLAAVDSDKKRRRVEVKV